MKISTFTYDGVDINITLVKNVLEFTFVKNEQKYGQKLQIKGRSKMDVVDATANLVICAIDSIKSIK